MRRIIPLLFFVLIACFAQPSEARKYALLIGVNEYVNVESLECCVNDMNLLKDALKKIDFDESEIQMLVTGGHFKNSPTKRNIEKSIANILSNVQPSDIVFIAFSGHGVQEGQNAYFCPPDVELDDVEETGVSIDKVMNDLANCQAKFKWMIVDACRCDPKKAPKGFGAKALRVIPAPPAGIALFQSCAKGEVSWEDREMGNSFFSKNLAAALSGEADSDRDGILTLMEVYKWTIAKTREQVENDLGETQRPYFSGNITDFTLSEDLNVPKAKALADEARQAMKAGDYRLAVEKFNAALALYPQFESWENERDMAQRLADSKPSFNPMNISVPGDFATIKEAYENVKDGGIITIQPGRYELSETLTVNRPVTFRGDAGTPEEVVIDCPSSDAFMIDDGSPLFQNLTASSGAEQCGGFYVTGGTPKIFRCIVTSRLAVGMYVQGENANPQVDSCIIKNCAGAGVSVYEKGRGTFNDCNIFGNASAGFVVNKSGNPEVIRCSIHDGKQGGVYVYDNGLGKFSDCNIYGNAKSGIEVKLNGNPTVTGCQIHDGKLNGVCVHNNGCGDFNNCDIYENANAGVEIYGSGNPTFTKCHIHDGKTGGIFVYDNGLGKFNNCDIYKNSSSGIEITSYGNPTVTGCQIHDGKNGGVWVYGNGMGSFYNNTLKRNYTNKILNKLDDFGFDLSGVDMVNDDWDIADNAGEVKGSGNTPPLP